MKFKKIPIKRFKKIADGVIKRKMMVGFPPQKLIIT